MRTSFSKIFVSVFLVLSFTRISSAEEISRIHFEFYSSDSTHVLKYNKVDKWMLQNKDGRLISKIKDEGFASMSIKVSDDGKYIVVVNDRTYPYKGIGNTPFIWLFKKGKLIHRFDFNEVLTDTSNDMIGNFGRINWGNFKSFDFNKDQSQFVFYTNDFFECIIDMKSGKLNKIRPVGFDENTIIVFGQFSKGKNNIIVMDIMKYIAGEYQLNNQIKFKSERFTRGRRYMTSVMIQNGVDITPDKFRGIYYRYNIVPKNSLNANTNL